MDCWLFLLTPAGGTLFRLPGEPEVNSVFCVEQVCEFPEQPSDSERDAEDQDSGRPRGR